MTAFERRVILSGKKDMFDQKMSTFRYEIIIYWSNADKVFIAEVPELPGCMADGQTYQEALENVEQIAQEWIETAKQKKRAVPKPKGRLVFA